jgi:type III secretion protein C
LAAFRVAVLRLAVGCVCGAGGMLWCAGAQAGAPFAAWKGVQYVYKGGPAASLREALETFAHAFLLDVQAEEGWPQASAAALLDRQARSPEAFLDRLAAVHGFQWFVQGTTLHVSPLASLVTERLDLGPMSEPAARAALSQRGLLVDKFGWTPDGGDAGVVVVTGPRAYVQSLTRAMRQLLPQDRPSRATDPAHEDDEFEPMIFKLRHAMAADTELRLRGGATVQMPGVAKVISELLAGRGRAPAPVRAAEDKRPSAKGAAADPLAGPWHSPLADQLERMAELAAGTGSGPLIKAYAPMNAVLVIDKPSRRERYARLIEQLDVPARQLEILVEIIDVDQSKLRDWSVGLDHRGSSVNTLPGGGAPPANIVLWSAERLSVRLKALETEGAAKVVLRPSIVALDNSTAMIDFSQSAYVPLVGERVAEVKEITVATSLKVTPHLLSSADDSPTLVTLQLEDGALEAPGTSTPPGATRGLISTQAVVREGEALVIGGRQQQTQSRTDSRIPGLSALPFIGKIFQSQSVRDETRDRIFVIRTRLLRGAPDTGGPVAATWLTAPADPRPCCDRELARAAR